MDFSYFLGYETSTLNLVVTSVFIGIVIASLAMIYDKRYIGNFVRKLLKKEALGEEEAISLKEAGYRKYSPIRFSLREGSNLRKRVKAVGENGEKKYYIPKENADDAEIHYNKKGTNIAILLSSILIFVLLATAIIKYYPVIRDKLTSNTEETNGVVYREENNYEQR